MRIDGRMFYADMCRKHATVVQKRFAELGLTAHTVTSDSKGRATYVGRSGMPFSSEEARSWLVENGYDVKPRGRLSVELIKVYADGH